MRPIVLLIALALAGCAGPRALERDLAGAPQAAACLEAYARVDQALEEAGVRDGEAHSVPGFPYLRVNRFLASFASRELDAAAFEAWVERLIELDRQGRTVELMNLPAAVRERLELQIGLLERCPEILRAHDFPARREDLIARAEVPDDYVTAMRVFGFYPLTAIPVGLGWQQWKARNFPPFEVPTAELAWQGQPVLYLPESDLPRLEPGQVAAILERSRANALGIPEPAGEDLRLLAQTFAPGFLIDTASDADRIGRPLWNEDGWPAVDVSEPVGFVRLAHAWFGGEVALQLVYAIWFPERPRKGPLDILGGRLDGLIWRVTLGNDGRPLVFDGIHACGCYHLFFPTSEVRRLPLPQDASQDLRETVEIPQTAPEPGPDERLALRVAAGSHYVTGLITVATDDGRWPVETYRLVSDEELPDAALRSMPLPHGGRRSLFGPDGIVSGTERPERFLLWPMGIESAGAMRQWGRHATAFVGRRHFDDPALLDEAFAR